MSRYLIRLILLLSFAGLLACQDSGEIEAGGNSTAPQLSDAARFDKEMRKKGCELLTSAMVQETFDVPADELRQMKIMGCRYDWENDGQTLEAGVSLLRVHKSEAMAATWFSNATQSKTAEEMAADMEEVARQMDKSDRLKNDKEKSMAKGILAAAGSKAVNFEDVAGVGDEARVNDEGNLHVRVDNLTFIVSAYHGSPMPPLDMQGADIQQMAKVVREGAENWARQTAPQRKQDSAKLARAIVGAL